MAKLKMLGDRVLIERDENQVYSSNPDVLRAAKSGLLVLPQDNSLEKIADTGIVRGKGPKCSEEFKVGDRIRFAQFAGINIASDDKRYTILRELDLHYVEYPE